MTIWGNHSATQYPDADNARINGKPVSETIGHTAWLRGEFIEVVQQRGAAVINARGASSAASAANAALDHVVSMDNATAAGDWFSGGVLSDGTYGIAPGLIFSYPLRSNGGGDWSIVQDLPLNDFAKEKIAATTAELQEEKAVVQDLLG